MITHCRVKNQYCRKPKCDLSKPIRRKIEIQWKKNQLNPTYLVREKSFRGNSIHEKARFTKYVESSEQNSSLTPLLRRWCAFFQLSPIAMTGKRQGLQRRQAHNLPIKKSLLITFYGFTNF